MTRRRKRTFTPPAAEVLETRALLTAGALDTTFAETGVVTIEDFGIGLDAEIQDDGKIVVAGQGDVSGGIVVRYNSDGSPDLAFGAIGAVSFPGNVADVDVLSDGKILVATLQNSVTSVTRINSDGSLDTTFGTGGTIQTGSIAIIPEIEVDSAGRIIALNPQFTSGFGTTPGAARRFNPDGSVDQTFGTNGSVTLNGIDAIADIAIDGDDNLVIASKHLYMVDSSGQLDTSFSGDGIVDDSGDYYNATFAPDGTLYAVGTDVGSTQGQVAAFDSAGNELSMANFAGNFLGSVQVDDVGNVVVGVGNFVVAEGDAAIIRFDSDLNLDTEFGTVTIGTDMSVRDVEIDDSGRILGTGFGPGTIFVSRVVELNDLPEANDDAASITEDAAPGTVSGNVLDNDTDSGPLVVSEVNGVAASVGVSVATTYGSVVINADGSYVYTLDNSNAAVQALNQGQILTDTIAYTALDDCDATGIANLEITINGADDEQTPSDKLDDLYDEIDSLIEDGDLSGRSGRYLTRTLDRVRRALDQGRTRRARTLVRAFRTQVVVLYVFRQLSLADAQTLFGLGSDLLNSL